MRALVLVLSLLATGPASAWYQIDCDTAWSGEEAIGRLEWHFGPLPERTEVMGYAEGGFQDIALQARLSMDTAGLKVFLARLGLRSEDLLPKAHPFLGSDGPRWFDYRAQEGLVSAEGRTNWLSLVSVAAARDPEVPGRWRIYLWANLT